MSRGLIAAAALAAILAHSAPPLAVAADAGVPPGPEDGGPRNWQATGVTGALNLREEPATTARVVASYPPGTILDNLGCLRAACAFAHPARSAYVVWLPAHHEPGPSAHLCGTTHCPILPSSSGRASQCS